VIGVRRKKDEEAEKDTQTPVARIDIWWLK
jgi:hypothetical protein